MQEWKRLQDYAFAAGQDWSREFQGKVLNALQLHFSATLTADGTGISTAFTDPVGQLLGVYEILQDETPLVRLPSDVFYWLCSYVKGMPLPLQMPASVAAAGTDVAHLATVLDFGAMVGPLGLLDARESKLFTRGKFAAVGAYSANLSSATGTVRQALRTTERIPRTGGDGIGYLRPRFWYQDVDISAGGSDLQATIRFEQDMYVPFLLLLAQDSSAGYGTANANPQNGRADGLVKSIRLDLQSRTTNAEVLRGSWAQFLLDTWAMTGYGGSMASAASTTMDRADPLTQRPQGVVALPLIDENNVRVNGAMKFQRGDALTLHLDTNATVEEQFTSATAAAGDRVRIAIPGFTPVTVGSGADEPGNADVARTPAAAPRGGFGRRRLVAAAR